MKLNQDKCRFLLSGHKHEVMFAKKYDTQKFGKIVRKNSKELSLIEI